MSGLEYTLLVLIAIVAYVIIGFRLMKLCDASGVGLGWFAFIPFLQETRLARLGNMNPWLVILGLIPIVNIVFYVLRWIWLWRIAGHTDAKQWWWVTLLGPIGIGIALGIFTDSGILTLIVSAVGLLIMAYASIMIFNPEKPVPGVADVRTPTA